MRLPQNNMNSRKNRTRVKIAARSDLPRLSVFRSNKFIYVQVIDDKKRTGTLAAAKGKDAKTIGEEIAKKLTELKVKAVVFDRGGYRYHGRVKALAESVRAGGIQL